MKKLVVSAVVFCLFAFAVSGALAQNTKGSPTWVGVSVNTNSGTVKPGVLEERFFGFVTNTIGLIDGNVVTNYDFPKGIALRSAGLFNGVPYPWYVTNFCGLLHIRTSPGDSTIVSSTDNVCLSTPSAYFVVDSNGSSGRAFSNVEIQAPSFSGNGDGLTVNSTNLGEWVQSTTTAVASVERRLITTNDAVEAVATHNFSSLTLGGETISSWPSGGGGASGSAIESVFMRNNYTLPATNIFGAIALDTTDGDVTLTLTAQTNFQRVVVTKFSNVNAAHIVWTTTNSLLFDAESLTLEYWPQMTNWYWRAY